MPLRPPDDAPDRERLRREAVDWLLRLDAAPDDPEVRDGWKRWLVRDSAHRDAWQDVSALWKGYRPMAGSEAPGARPLPGEMRKKRIGFQVLPWLATAVAVLVLLVRWPIADWGADWVTGTAEQQSVILTDGSTAKLTAQTALAVRHEGQERRVELLHGEAIFRVRPDRAHPFIVTSRGGSTRALGTEFLVAQHGGATTVAVLKGKVEVTAEQETLQLTSGHVARYRLGHVPARLPEATLSELTAWHEGYLRFSRTPLGQVIEAVNRYHPAKIVLMNRALAERPVSGQFPLGETEHIIDTVVETAALRRVDVTPYVVLLY